MSTFPTTGILDDFNRGDQTPPSANWTDSWRTGGGTQLVTNEIVAPFTGDSYWNVATFGPASEVYAAIGSSAVTFATFGLRLTTPTFGSTSGYLLNLDGFGTAQFIRIDSGVETTIGSSFSYSVGSPGETLGFDIQSTLMSAYEGASGSWSFIGNTTDGTYTTAGYIGLSIDDGSGAWDDFGGGTVVTAATTTPPRPFVVDTAVARAANY